MRLSQVYDQKHVHIDTIGNYIEPGQDIITTLFAGEAYTLMKQLEQYDHLKGNRLFQMLSTREVIHTDPDKVRVTSLFLGAFERQAFKAGQIDLLPNHFSDLPRLLQEMTTKPVVMAVVSPMDEHGYFSLGTNCDYIATLIPYAGAVVLEVNDHMPRTFGKNQVHISEVTAFIENHQPIPEGPASVQPSEKDQMIGGHVAELIKNGDVLQVGFGSIPNAIMDYVKHYRNLSIHTEMIPGKVIDLFESGAVTNEHNPFEKGKMTATFAYGSRQLYDFLHENDDVYMLPVNETNAGEKLHGMKNLVTVNAGVEVDFLGQVNAEKVADTYWSSTGGQADFQSAARVVEGGRGVICMYATVKNDTISKIVPALNPGTPVTTSKNDVDYVVTEYGLARLRGKTIRERAQALINIAHPKFRDELTHQARVMGCL